MGPLSLSLEVVIRAAVVAVVVAVVSCSPARARHRCRLIGAITARLMRMVAAKVDGYRIKEALVASVPTSVVGSRRVIAVVAPLAVGTGGVVGRERMATPALGGCSPRIECRRAIHQGELGPVGPPGLVALRLTIAVDRVSTDSLLFPSKVIAVGVARGACVMEVAKRRLRRPPPHRQEEAREERGPRRGVLH